MRYICVNLKRFDIPEEYDGINNIAPIHSWGSYLAEHIQKIAEKYEEKAQFIVFFPEAHLIPAMHVKNPCSKWHIGGQGVYREDTEKNGNFGAFTTNHTAKTLKALGCDYVIIGHCEERIDKNGILAEAGVTDRTIVNRILNREIKQAVSAGLYVLYCGGENEAEQECWEQVLEKQLDMGLAGIDKKKIIIGYEPLWSIGPGKPVPDKNYILKVSEFIKRKTKGCAVIYGGGLKEENAEMLSAIESVDGGLIGLTSFSGKIGFYPEGFERITARYLGGNL